MLFDRLIETKLCVFGQIYNKIEYEIRINCKMRWRVSDYIQILNGFIFIYCYTLYSALLNYMLNISLNKNTAIEYSTKILLKKVMLKYIQKSTKVILIGSGCKKSKFYIKFIKLQNIQNLKVYTNSKPSCSSIGFTINH